MSKARKSKKKRRGPNISPVALLRPRLDALWRTLDGSGQEISEQFATLDNVTTNISTEEFIPIMLRAYRESPPSAQEALAQVIPMWFKERGHVDLLHKLAGRYLWEPDDQATAVAWLEGADVDVTALVEERPSHFFRALMGEDVKGYQGLILIFWYTDQRRNRVQGMSILLDYESPWNGSVKDIIPFPKRPAGAVVEEFINFWDNVDEIEFEELDEVDAKEEIIEALLANREHDIRLPADLIAIRDQFVRYVLSLADGPDAEPFSEDEFNHLCTSGRLMLDVRRAEEQMSNSAPDWSKLEDDDDDVYLEESY